MPDLPFSESSLFFRSVGSTVLCERLKTALSLSLVTIRKWPEIFRLTTKSLFFRRKARVLWLSMSETEDELNVLRRRVNASKVMTFHSTIFPHGYFSLNGSWNAPHQRMFGWVFGYASDQLHIEWCGQRAAACPLCHKPRFWWSQLSLWLLRFFFFSNVRPVLISEISAPPYTVVSWPRSSHRSVRASGSSEFDKPEFKTNQQITHLYA